jgi:hypothetical protein
MITYSLAECRSSRPDKTQSVIEQTLANGQGDRYQSSTIQLVRKEGGWTAAGRKVHKVSAG